MFNVRYTPSNHGIIKFSLPDEVVTFNDLFYVIFSSLKKAFPDESGESLKDSFSLKLSDSSFIGDIIEYDDDISDWITDGTIDVVTEDNPHPNTNSMDSNLFDTELTTIINNFSEALSRIDEYIRRDFEVLDDFIDTLPEMTNVNNDVFNGRITLGRIENITSIFRMIGNMVTITSEQRVTVLSKEGFDKLHSRIYESSQEEISDENILCIICQCDFENGDEIKTLPCNHEFHADCVQSWLLNEKNECPMCRKEVTGETTTNTVEISHDIDLSSD